MDFLQKTEVEFKLGINLAETFLARCRRLAFPSGDDVTYETAMLFFFCKSYKTYQAIRHLWRTGFYEDAWLLTRTLFEVWIQAAYMMEKPRERARQFAQHDPIRQYKAYLELRRVGADELVHAFEDNPNFSGIQGEYKKMERQAQAGGAKPALNWWGKSIKALAEELGKPFSKEYVTGYWWQSNHVHSTVTAVQDYVAESDGKLKLNCHAGDQYPVLDVKLAPRRATGMMICIVEKISEGLSIDIREQIESAKGEVSKTSNDRHPQRR